MKEKVQALISFLESDTEPSIVLDTDYTILGANNAYLAAYGVDSSDALPVGRKCYEVSHHYDKPCDLSGELCPMSMARKTKAASKLLHIHYTPRGQEHVDVELRPILDGDQQVIAFVERINTIKSASVQATGDGLVGSSPVFNKALSDLSRVAKTDLPVLLQGESGTGKELFARAVHDGSPRKKAPFVVVDCTGLSDNLFESELFGYEKGAFTGAIQAKAGLIETAQGGTVFLDEIGDVPLTMQVKLLRLLESGTFRRVGGLDTKTSNFRLVAATHKPLHQMVKDGTFRADLFYRICVFPIELPALRNRREDIPKLVHSLLRRGAGPLGMRYVVSEPAMRLLTQYHWPGNIRQLKNVLDRARVFCDDGRIEVEHLPSEWNGPEAIEPEAIERTERVLETTAQAVSPQETQSRGAVARKLSIDELKEIDKTFVGSRKELAEKLGISERTLYRKLG
ncbi:MAG: sigma 54-interacting transcriptional regulator [Limnobacter sp.]|nr:sigma 54-interacting transcriptional regulator [Limnobacter sp.]